MIVSLSLALTGARLALAVIASREFAKAFTLPRGRLRRRHAVQGVVVLAGSLIRL